MPHQSQRPTSSRSTAGPRWIDPKWLQRFAAEGTDAHRLASSRELWIERFREDILINYQHESLLQPAREALKDWAAQANLKVTRVFGRFIPRQNEERSTPVLLEGDPALSLVTTVREGGLRYGLDFAAG